MGQLTIALRPEHHDKIKKVNEISGENVKLCMQCGTCSAVCPMVESMKMTTRQAMLLLQYGLTDDVIDSKLATLCASCHTCSVRFNFASSRSARPIQTQPTCATTSRVFIWSRVGMTKLSPG